MASRAVASASLDFKALYKLYYIIIISCYFKVFMCNFDFELRFYISLDTKQVISETLVM